MGYFHIDPGINDTCQVDGNCRNLQIWTFLSDLVGFYCPPLWHFDAVLASGVHFITLADSMKSLLVVIFLFLCPLNAYSKDIVVGGDDIVDACSSLAEVKAKNFIYLRADPSTDGVVVGKLDKGHRFFVCIETNGWYGVVVPQNDNMDCGVSTPWLAKKKYKGPCKAGWLEIRQADILAD